MSNNETPSANDNAQAPEMLDPSKDPFAQLFGQIRGWLTHKDPNKLPRQLRLTVGYGQDNMGNDVSVFEMHSESLATRLVMPDGQPKSNLILPR